MHAEPLEPGQVFSFIEPVYAIECRGNFGSVFMSTSPEDYEKWTRRRLIIGPERRLMVQDDVYFVGDAWQAHAWLSEFDGHGWPLSFVQQLGPEVIQTFVPAWSRHVHISGALAVKDVGWPEPTPESLMVQVRALSYWHNGSARSRIRKPTPIRWRECGRLARMPLHQGLPEALRMLQGHVDDPAAALRARGFVV